MSKG
jgi:serine/threonine protein kinase